MKKTLSIVVAHINNTRVKILMCCLIIATINVSVIYFIGQEQYIYFWDYAGYWDKYTTISDLFTASPSNGLKTLIWSVRDSNYNFLPVFALIPFNVIFGPSRLAYILILANVYGITAAFSSALLLRTAVQRREDQSGAVATTFIGIVTTALLPQFWSPVLLGLPDVVGILFVNLILFIYFRRRIEEQSGMWWVALGFSLCCLVLLRRWYAYWIVSFFIAFGLESTFISIAGPGFTIKRYLNSLRPVLVVGMVATMSMLLFAGPMAKTMLVANYADIYSAYKESSSFLEVVAKVCSRFGAVIVLLFLVSATKLMSEREVRRKAMFLLIHLVAVIVLFSRVQDFNSQHYYLLIPTLVFFISVWAARSYLSLKTRPARAVFLTAYMLALLANFSVVFVPSAAGYFGRSALLLSQERRYPLVRSDIAELRRMLSLVDQLAAKGNGSVYVLASSEILNDDIVRHVGKRFDKRCLACAQIVGVSHVDKRDGLRRTFWDAKWVIVADPIQYHLRPEDQRVIGIPAYELLSRRGIGLSYRKLAYEFALDGGVKAYVYEKVRPFEKEAVDSVEREFLDHYPNSRELLDAAPGS